VKKKKNQKQSKQKEKEKVTCGHPKGATRATSGQQMVIPWLRFLGALWSTESRPKGTQKAPLGHKIFP